MFQKNLITHCGGATLKPLASETNCMARAACAGGCAAEVTHV